MPIKQHTAGARVPVKIYTNDIASSKRRPKASSAARTKA